MMPDHSDPQTSSVLATQTSTAVRPGPASPTDVSEYRHVLVPSGLEPRDQEALTLGLRMAAAHGAKATVLHIVPPVESAGSMHWLDAIEALHRVMKEPQGHVDPAQDVYGAERIHARLKQQLQSTTSPELRSRVEVRTAFRVGDVVDQIARYVAENDVDLVIVSSATAGSWRALWSSRVQQLLQQVPARVIVLRPNAASLPRLFTTGKVRSE